MRRALLPASLLTVAALAVSLSACTTSAEPPSITVSEVEGLFAPVAVRIDGLPAGQTVTLAATTTVDGTVYAAEASFEVGGSGTVDLTKDQPASGDWTGVDAMAPFWSMTGKSPSSWLHWSAWNDPFDVELAVVDESGRELAQTIVARPGAAPDIDVKEVNTPTISGLYATPTDMDPATPRPAVLVFGGSEGGTGAGGVTAQWLAGLGYPALGISYFGSDNQPATLEDVPVETFEAALAWLREQPGINRDRVYAFGVSRGGEMALWLAAEHPDLLAGAFAPVGAGALVCGYPKGNAWTRGGAPLADPCAMNVVGLPTNQIDVTAIDGPVVLACGTLDPLWPSCAALDDMVKRRGESSETFATRGEGARHGVAWAPYVPMPESPQDNNGQRAATREVQRLFWNDVAKALG